MDTGIFSSEGDIDIHEAIQVADNGGWGIHAKGGDVSINALLQSAQLSKVNNNGKGGIRADAISDGACLIGGSVVVMKIEVQGNGHQVQNGGHGIEAKGGVKVGFARILNNTGFGVWAAENLTIEGACEIHNNGGWGIRADERVVEICDGVNISGNGQGDIYCPVSAK